MPVSTNDLTAFQQFALAKVNNGGADSIVELAVQWEATRELLESAVGIRESIADADSGDLVPAKQTFAGTYEILCAWWEENRDPGKATAWMDAFTSGLRKAVALGRIN